MDKPGGGRAGGWSGATAGAVVASTDSVPKEPNPKSKLSSSPAVVSQWPMLSTFDRALVVTEGFAGFWAGSGDPEGSAPMDLETIEDGARSRGLELVGGGTSVGTECVHAFPGTVLVVIVVEGAIPDSSLGV
jgi:hypothetical protein